MRLEPLDQELARETYLSAWTAGIGRAGDVLVEICHAIRNLPRGRGAPHALDLLLHGLALLTTDGRAAATPTLLSAAKALPGIPVEDVLRWGWSASGAIAAAWDDEAVLAICARNVQLTRDTGALADLPIHLSALSFATAFVGDFAGAAALISEIHSVAAATGRVAHDDAGLMGLRALQGKEAEALALINATVKPTEEPRQGIRVTTAHWAAAVLFNGLGRYEEAVSAARQADSNTFEPWASMWALPELVEAATRAGDSNLACDALERLAVATQPAGTDWALGVEARCRALVREGADADGLYREAIERLGRTLERPELARAHLLYGEWLGREGRRFDARKQLRTAHDIFVAIGMEAFAERARRELIATGEKMRKRSDQTRDELTPQEEQIARLARVGLSNPEIGAQLFISARTVEWHLGKVFTKLRISSRRELRAALPEHGGLFASA
jgi:DNA-binding CsgD family transcriptional regulator